MCMKKEEKAYLTPVMTIIFLHFLDKIYAANDSIEESGRIFNWGNFSFLSNGVKLRSVGGGLKKRFNFPDKDSYVEEVSFEADDGTSLVIGWLSAEGRGSSTTSFEGWIVDVDSFFLSIIDGNSEAVFDSLDILFGSLDAEIDELISGTVAIPVLADGDEDKEDEEDEEEEEEEEDISSISIWSKFCGNWYGESNLAQWTAFKMGQRDTSCI